MNEISYITAIRYFKKSDEFVITTRNDNTGRISKTHSNHLTNDEKTWARASKYYFEDETCVCWMS